MNKIASKAKNLWNFSHECHDEMIYSSFISITVAFGDEIRASTHQSIFIFIRNSLNCNYSFIKFDNKIRRIHCWILINVTITTKANQLKLLSNRIYLQLLNLFEFSLNKHLIENHSNWLWISNDVMKLPSIAKQSETRIKREKTFHKLIFCNCNCLFSVCLSVSVSPIDWEKWITYVQNERISSPFIHFAMSKYLYSFIHFYLRFFFIQQSIQNKSQNELNWTECVA